MRRVARGVKRFVLEAKKPFLVTLNHGGGHDHAPRDLDQPMRTIAAARDAHALVAPIVAGVGGRAGQSPERSGALPLGTVTAKGDAALVAPYLVPRYGEREGQDPRTRSVETPLPTITPTENGSRLVAALLAKHYGGHETPGAPLGQPMSTLTTQDHHHLVAASLAKLRGTSADADPAAPLGTVSAGGTHHGLIAAHLSTFYGDHDGRDDGGTRGAELEEPLRTQGTADRHRLVAAFLSKFYGQGVGAELDQPAPTATTKDRSALVTVTIQGEPYVVADIAMRMLQPRELYNAQGFPPGYIIDRGADGRRLTKTEQVRMVGNSVSPPQAAALVAANVPELVARDEVAA